MKFWVIIILMMLSLSTQANNASNFQFTDIQGKTFKLSDYRGKWVIINFYATWCPLCWAEVPTLNKLNTRHDVDVIGIALDYGLDKNVVFNAIQRYNIMFDRHVFGGDRKTQNSIFRQVGPVDFFPTSYVYDPKGNLVMFVPGQFKENVFLNFISKYEILQK